MPVDWNPGLFKIEIDFIDEQHTQLFIALGKLKDAYGKDNEKAAIEEMIEFLYQYCLKHFKDEEEYMKSISFPGLDEQKLMHKNFLENYFIIKSKFESEGPSKKLMLHIYNDIFKWLVNHISNDDKKIADFVNK